MTGSIRAERNDPLILEWGDSVAVVYNVEDTEVVRISIADLLGKFQKGAGEPILLFVDQETAHIYAVPKARIPW